jgi:glycosyltransferase involved in cell wall biosynthesis
MPATIVHLIGQLMRGGSERQLIEVVAGLHERGWSQAVVTFNPGENWDYRVVEAGARLVTIPRSRWKAARLFRLWMIARNERPSIIHSWSAHTNAYLARLPRFASRFAKVGSLRGDPSVDRITAAPLGTLRTPKTYGRLDLIVSNSQHALDRIREAGVVARGRVVGNIVHPRGRAEPSHCASPVRLVAAGELIPLKGYDVLLEALALLRARGFALELHLAGKGEQRESLEAQARALGLHDEVVFHGEVEDVPLLMAGCHLAVHPSLSEGLSNTVLEAMAEGLPVVATAVGGIPEVVRPECGTLVAPGNTQQLAEALAPLLADGAMRARMGSSGLEHVRAHLNTSLVIAQYEDAYNDALRAAFGSSARMTTRC